MMNHAFNLSEVGRFLQHRRHEIRGQLLERQAAVDSGVQSLAKLWDRCVWQPLDDQFGALTIDDLKAGRKLRVYYDVHNQFTQHNQDPLSWLHTTYLERQALLGYEGLSFVMAKPCRRSGATASRRRGMATVRRPT